MQTYKNAHYRLTFANENFEWANAPRPGLPIIRWPDGTLCEPALYFFGYSAEKKRVKVSSMGPEAYALREWFVFLANNRLTLFDVSDDVMEHWRTQQGWLVVKKNERRKLQPSHKIRNIRISRKLHYVFEFYRVLTKAMPFGPDGGKTPKFIDESNKGPITSKMIWNGRQKKEVPVWSRAETFLPSPKPPRSPRESDVIRLYGLLRGKAFREQQKLKLAFPPEGKQTLADRDWLLSRAMALAGLRCAEVRDVNVDQLAEALFENGITKELLDLDRIANDKTLQQSIVGKILSLRKGTEHAFVRVLVKGKGDKERWAPFDPQLVCDLLEIGVWGIRANYLMTQKALRANSPPSRHLFLSEKTGDPLGAKPIGDIIGAAFRELGIRSSAHKLRAFFATNTAAALWREYFALNRYNFDPSLVNNVLQNLASALGHSRVTTTIKYYVNAPLFKHLTKVGTPEAELFRKLYDLLVMRNNGLSTLRQSLLVELATLLVEHEDNSKIVQALQLLIKHPEMGPRRSPSPGPALVFEAKE